jgi:hypothetical protein
VDYGTTNAISVNDLAGPCSLCQWILCLLNGDMSTLALFVCKYAVHASTIKDDLKKRIRLEQQKASDDKEEANMWVRVLLLPPDSASTVPTTGTI